MRLALERTCARCPNCAWVDKLMYAKGNRERPGGRQCKRQGEREKVGRERGSEREMLGPSDDRCDDSFRFGWPKLANVLGFSLLSVAPVS